MDLMKQISGIGVIPVIKINDTSKAVGLAKALIKGGLPAAEVTFRTKNADEAIKLIAENCPEMVVGAGTVLTIEQAKRAKECGAKFIVAPGFNPKIVQWCIDNDIQDIRKMSQLQWGAVCMFCGQYIKNNKILWNIEKSNATGGGCVYDTQKISELVDIWAYLCRTYSKTPLLADYRQGIFIMLMGIVS